MKNTRSNRQQPSKKVSKRKPVPNESPDDPFRLARQFLHVRCKTQSGEITLFWWRDEWWMWDGEVFRLIPFGELKADLTKAVKDEFDRLNVEELKRPRKDDDKIPIARKVTTALIGNVLNALVSDCKLSSKIEQPSWLSKSKPFPAAEGFTTKTGIIHIPSRVLKRRLYLLTPQYFSSGIVDYGYDPDATCPNWLKFLDSIWGNDSQSIECLQEWFGYLILPDTRQHKLLLLIGPTRSGKGTIAKVLRALIGERLVANPTLSSLSRPFGLWPLLNKTVGIFPDARLGNSTNAMAVTESLLSISGEDLQDVDRKCLPTLSGIKLPIRFVLMSNELPNLEDASGAFANRVVMLRMIKSFLGRENRHLDKTLLSELPGILNWAILGWQRLEVRGHFVHPESSLDLMNNLRDLTSPISAFVRDVCVIGPEFNVGVSDLFEEWTNWCHANRRKFSGNSASFAKDLYAQFPQLWGSQPRMSNSRIRIINGIGLRNGTGWHELNFDRDQSEDSIAL